MKIRIILVDNHEILREGLRCLVGAEPDIDLVAAVSTGREAIRLVDLMLPELVVMDVSMPELNGVEATLQILAKHPDTKIVALSAHLDRRTAVRLIQAGARGLVPKMAAFEELVSAIREVAAGKIYISPHLPMESLSPLISQPTRRSEGGLVAALSPREQEVLRLIAEGNCTKEIAFCLDVSVKTVETHRRNLMDKLNLDNVADLTKHALREGLVTLSPRNSDLPNPA